MSRAFSLPALIVSLCANAPAAHAKEPTPTLVLDLASTSLSAADLATLSEELRAELARFPDLAVVSHQDLVKLIGVEAERQLIGCDSASCMAELGGALGAPQLVTGTIAAFGRERLVQLQLIDTRRASVIRRVSHKAMKEDLAAAVRVAAKQLMDVPAMLHLVNQMDGAEVFVADKPVGVMPLKPFPVSESGTVTVRVEHVDCLPFETQVELSPGRLTRLPIDLKRWADVQAAAKSRRGLGLGLTAGAVLALAGSGTLFWDATRVHDTYANADPRRTTAARFHELESQIQTRERWGAVAGVAGVTLAATGLWLWLSNPYEAELSLADRPVLSVGPGAVSLSLTF